MLIAKSFVALLNAATPITAIVGTRIYPALLPEGSPLPAVVYDFESAEPDLTCNGPSGLVKQTATVSALSTLYSTTDDLANKIRTALNGLGANGYVVAGIEVLDISWSGETESNEQLSDAGQESTVYIKSVEFSVWFRMPSTS